MLLLFMLDSQIMHRLKHFKILLKPIDGCKWMKCDEIIKDGIWNQK